MDDASLADRVNSVGLPTRFAGNASVEVKWKTVLLCVNTHSGKESQCKASLQQLR